MVLESTAANRVELVARTLSMEQEADMNLFYIMEHHLVNTSHPRKGVSMDIKFKRKIMSEMMTTYLPSMLLMMITFATTFFKPHLIEAALSVNLTTMLVMTTIFISKMEGLPPTSDIKMIDIWLILCQMVPFVQVVLLTAVEYLREEDQQERAEEKILEDSDVGRQNDEKVVELKVENETEPQEAWVPIDTKPTARSTDRTNVMQTLLIVGKLLLDDSEIKVIIAFHCREETDALGCIDCIHHLRLHCNRLLL